MDTSNLGIRLTRNACKVAARKGFTPDAIIKTYRFGEQEPNPDHPGQFTIAGNGITLVGAPAKEHFVVITCYGEVK